MGEKYRLTKNGVDPPLKITLTHLDFPFVRKASLLGSRCGRDDIKKSFSGSVSGDRTDVYP